MLPRNDGSAIPAPLYVTVGPQCAGKSTLMKSLQTQPQSKQEKHSTDATNNDANPSTLAVQDVTLDDQLDVYVPIPTRLFLQNGDTMESSTTKSKSFNGNDDDDAILLHTTLHGKSWKTRIYDDSMAELRFVLQRIHGILSPLEFRNGITGIYQAYSGITTQQQQHNTTTTNKYLQVAQELIQCVEDDISSLNMTDFSETVDLFLVESLFRPHPRTNQTGIDAGHQQLLQLAQQTLHVPVAWGNTNTRPREYQTALEVAEQTKRPVHFIVYADRDACRVKNGMFLSHVGTQELIRRNVQRFKVSGKYVPAKAILEASERVENLVQSALRELDRSSSTMAQTTNTTRREPQKSEGNVSATSSCLYSKFELDAALAKLIHYEMNPDRTVRYVGPPMRRKRDSPSQPNERGAQQQPQQQRARICNNNGRPQQQQQQPWNDKWGPPNRGENRNHSRSNPLYTQRPRQDNNTNNDSRPPPYTGTSHRGQGVPPKVKRSQTGTGNHTRWNNET